MNQSGDIRAVKPITNDIWGLVGGGINDYNKAQAGDDHAQTICYVLYGPDGEPLGGIVAELYWDWLYINLMFVREELRGQGYGARLLALAEDEARGRGATRAHLDTFSFQAPGFYEKAGYTVFGELPDFPAPHTRYYMTKQL